MMIMATVILLSINIPHNKIWHERMQSIFKDIILNTILSRYYIYLYPIYISPNYYIIHKEDISIIFFID